jgi:hypothetical protein
MLLSLIEMDLIHACAHYGEYRQSLLETELDLLVELGASIMARSNPDIRTRYVPCLEYALQNNLRAKQAFQELTIAGNLDELAAATCTSLAQKTLGPEEISTILSSVKGEPEALRTLVTAGERIAESPTRSPYFENLVQSCLRISSRTVTESDARRLIKLQDQIVANALSQGYVDSLTL